MKMHRSVLASVVVVALTASVGARADETSTETPRTAAPPLPEAPRLLEAEGAFVESARLNNSWVGAVRAATDMMNQIVVDKQQARMWGVERRLVFQVRLTPLAPQWPLALRLRREVRAARAVLEPGPMWIEPVTAGITDAHGERGELLGLRLTLPWLFP